jgi:hypothetical protein
LKGKGFCGIITDRKKLNPEKFPEFSKRKDMFVNTKKGEPSTPHPDDLGVAGRICGRLYMD